MKTKPTIFGSLAIVGVGLWYLSANKKSVNYSVVHGSTDRLQKEHTGSQHIREVFHSDKEMEPKTVI